MMHPHHTKLTWETSVLIPLTQQKQSGPLTSLTQTQTKEGGGGQLESLMFDRGIIVMPTPSALF